MKKLTDKQLEALAKGRKKGIKRRKRGPLSIEVIKKISDKLKNRHNSIRTEWKKGFIPIGSILFKKGHISDRKGKKFPELSRENSSTWKGGKILHQGKYWLIFKPEHPDADGKGYIREHRLIMEQYLGRRLKNNELIHHKNENTKDNRIENLELISRSNHIKVHRSELYEARWHKNYES